MAGGFGPILAAKAELPSPSRSRPPAGNAGTPPNWSAPHDWEKPAALTGLLSRAIILSVKQIGHPHEFGERIGSHLLHYPASMFLDGAFAGAELGADLLVQQSGCDQSEDLSLSRRQAAFAFFQFEPLMMFGSPQPRKADALSDHSEQRLIVKRLFQTVQRAGSHRLNPDRHVGMPGDEGNRNKRVSPPDFREELQAVHSGQADVGDDAIRIYRFGPGEKTLGR